MGVVVGGVCIKRYIHTLLPFSGRLWFSVSWWRMESVADVMIEESGCSTTSAICDAIYLSL